MALKTSNKNRKKDVVNNQITDSVTQKQPIDKWWWFTDNPKFYFVGAGVLALVLLFL